MVSVFGRQSGEVCQDSGIYRSECGHRILIEEGKHFPDSGSWSKVNNLPDVQELAVEHARQRFWEAFA